jgi:flavin reductase (DIM6/NTAB) family NADH-FMN oxidoreductase RutF
VLSSGPGAAIAEIRESAFPATTLRPGLAQRAAVFAVHVVDEDNKAIAQLFGGETGDEVDKFAQVRWHYVDGVPILEDCPRWFTGAVLEQIEMGDHVGHLLEPLRVETGPASGQLTYQQARDIKAGHKPWSVDTPRMA